jgi:membrane-bound lytic murein transglycosylase B
MKIIKILIILSLLFFTKVHSEGESFESWKNSFKQIALKKGITESTFDLVMKDVKFLPKVIKYDRYQPEFYEDTKTYIDKRTSKNKIKKGKELYQNNKELIETVEKKFDVEKELLLALMGIETNFGTYLGKMDILSSLSTLSFDKRRSDFFTTELITLLQLVEKDLIDHNILYGSWAGAFGNFQFMPTTIKNYALDYDNNNIIELKSLNDSFASAANYINKIGWKKNSPCYLKIILSDKIPKKYLNTSAKNINNKKKIAFFKKFIVDVDNYNFDDDEIVGIITPDKDIVENSDNLKPAFIVFNNYELILKWNRSLRFALAVCNLKNKFTDEL